MGDTKNSGISASREFDDARSDAEAAKIRDAALLRALSTPHKRQKEMKLGRTRSGKKGPQKPSEAKKAR